jgi:hypothetical protein
MTWIVAIRSNDKQGGTSSARKRERAREKERGEGHIRTYGGLRQNNEKVLLMDDEARSAGNKVLSARREANTP